MALTQEDLQAIRAIVHEEVKAESKIIRSEMKVGFDFLEKCVNEAAKDTQLTIKQHEKEWHSA